jgi:hypothetical protein
VDAHQERKTGIPLSAIIVFLAMLLAGAGTALFILAE